MRNLIEANGLHLKAQTLLDTLFNKLYKQCVWALVGW